MSQAVVGARSAGADRSAKVRGWGIRRKLILALAIPTLAALALGGINLRVALDATAAYTRIEHLSQASKRVLALVTALQSERDLTAKQAAIGGPTAPVVDQQRRVVDRAASDMRNSLLGVDGPSYGSLVQRHIKAALDATARLPAIRDRKAVGSEAAVSLVRDYSAVIDKLLQIIRNLRVGGGDETFVEQAAGLGDVSQAAELASQQRALLSIALQSGGFKGSVLADLVAARAQQQAAVDSFFARSLPQYQDIFRHMVPAAEVDPAGVILRKAVASGSTKGLGADSQQWYLLQSQDIGQTNSVAILLLRDFTDRAHALRVRQQRSALTGGLIVLLILVFAIGSTAMVARSIIRPLRRLRAAAFDVADHGLPEVVRRLHEGEAQDFDGDVQPVAVGSKDEIGQVAKAFDEVHAQAVRLAGEQALLRKNTSAMFVNLSRRSQGLVERQLRVIDELETGEQDPDQLASLFTLDLLATRMRRNDENLLVLAGEEGGRRWTTPVALLDVVRAAVAEVEQYARIRPDIETGFDIASNAVGGVVHLLAELLENAAGFSAPGTPVDVRARSLGASGEIMIEIEDQGIGMTTSQMEQVNERLADAPTFDVSASRMMGLYVVARLAARHEIRVRLRSSAQGGVIALVQLPARIVLPAAAPPAPSAPRHGRLDAAPAVTNGSRPIEPLPRNDLLRSELPRNDVPRTAPAVSRPGPRPRDASAESLPIFETVQSEWFSRPAAYQPGPAVPHLAAQPAARTSWSSPADEGWEVAQVVSTPVSGGVTAAGLPIRVRGSNLIPGSAGVEEAVASPPHTHAALGLSSFQQGIARGRAGEAADPEPTPAGVQPARTESDGWGGSR